MNEMEKINNDYKFNIGYNKGKNDLIQVNSNVLRDRGRTDAFIAGYEKAFEDKKNEKV